MKHVGQVADGASRVAVARTTGSAEPAALGRHAPAPA